MGTRSFSQFSTFGMCPRKHQLSRRYEPKVKAAALAEGDVFHLCLGKMYAQGKPDAGWEIFEVTRDNYISEAKASEASAESMEKLEAKFSNLRAMLSAYIDHILVNDLRHYEILSVEEEFVVALDEKTDLRGFVDGVWRDRKSGVRFIAEHKYKSSHEDDLMPMDLQVSLYTLALLDKYGHLPTLYNVALKPTNRRGKNESFQNFVARVADAVKDETASGFRWTPGEYTSKRFLRRTYSRGKAELAVALQQARSMARVMDLVERDPGMVWRNVGDHCLYFCPFKLVCIEEDPMLIERYYNPKDSAPEVPRPI